MPTGLADRRVLTVRCGEGHVDIAVPADTSVDEALAAVGVDLHDTGAVAVDVAGKVVDPQAPPLVPDGSVICVVTPPPPLKRSAREAEASTHEYRRFALPITAIAPMLALLVTMATYAGLLPALTWPWRLSAAALLGLVSVLAAVVAADAALLAAGSSIALVLLSGFATGFVGIDVTLPAAADLAVFAGLATVTSACALLYALTRGRILGRCAGMLLAFGIVATVVWAAAFFCQRPAAMACAVLCGLAPPLLRMLPAWCVDVPPSQLIDFERNTSQRWTVRGRPPAATRAVGNRAVEATVQAAERQANVGTIVLSAIPALTIPVVFAAGMPFSVAWWGSLGLALLVSTAMALQPRSARNRLARIAPRIGSGVVLLITAGYFGAYPTADWLVLAIGGLLIVALALAAASVLIGRGTRSMSLSRAGDIFQAVATAASLPAALIAADAFATIRGLVG